VFGGRTYEKTGALLGGSTVSGESAIAALIWPFVFQFALVPPHPHYHLHQRDDPVGYVTDMGLVIVVAVVGTKSLAQRVFHFRN
jgi:hypothetical protein